MSITKIRVKVSCESDIEESDECVSALIVCPVCHAENPVTFNNSLIREEHMHIQTKDESILNFENAMRKCTGVQDPPPAALIEKLNAYMKSRNYPTREDVWDLPLDEYNKRGNTTCKMLIDALSTLREEKVVRQSSSRPPQPRLDHPKPRLDHPQPRLNRLPL